MARDAFAPSHRSADLVDQSRPDLSRGLRSVCASLIGDERDGRLANQGPARERSPHDFGGRLHQAAVERRRDLKQDRSLDTPFLGQSRSARATAPAGTGDHDLPTAVVIGDDRTPRPHAAASTISRARSVLQLRATPPWRPPRLAPPSCMASPRTPEELSAAVATLNASGCEAEGVNIPRANGRPRRPCPGRKIEIQFLSASTRRAARLTASNAGCALAVRVSSSSGPPNIRPRQVLGQAPSFDLGEQRTRDGESCRQEPCPYPPPASPAPETWPPPSFVRNLDHTHQLQRAGECHQRSENVSSNTSRRLGKASSAYATEKHVRRSRPGAERRRFCFFTGDSRGVSRPPVFPPSLFFVRAFPGLEGLRVGSASNRKA